MIMEVLNSKEGCVKVFSPDRKRSVVIGFNKNTTDMVSYDRKWYRAINIRTVHGRKIKASNF